LQKISSVVNNSFPETSGSQTYIEIVKKMLAYSHSQKMVVTKADTANYTLAKSDEICSNFKVIYWTKHQKMITAAELKRVIFTSDYGTGKSTLLKAKAFEIVKEKKKKCSKIINTTDKLAVIFINFLDENVNLLHNQLKSDFESYEDFIHIIALDSVRSKF
jgi:hypothetical protein